MPVNASGQRGRQAQRSPRLERPEFGVAGTLEVIEIARAAGLGLMIGAMVECRLGCGFSAHLAAGVGGFEVVDLDTPFLLAEDPVIGGCLPKGPVYELGNIEAGHGSSLSW